MRSPAVVDARLGTATLAALLAAAAAWVTVDRPDLLRVLIAAGFVGLVLTLAVLRPAAAALITLLALPFEAFLRRLLTGLAGVPANDPLILTGPVVAAALFAGLFVVRRRPLGKDLLSRLVLIFLALAVLGIVNPAGGGLTVELGGLLFLAAPLLWFFLGRELGDPPMVRRLLTAMVALGVVVAVYGLFQTQVGMPRWDRMWVEMNAPTYQSLNVGLALRPFSTFSSNAEYALWVGGALAVAIAAALHGRAVLVLAVPLLAVAELLASVRSALVLAVLAVTVTIGLRSRRLPVAAVVIVIGLGAAYAGVKAYGAAAGQAASGNDLVARQVSGITNPLDPTQSTLLAHVNLLVNGLRSGIDTPLGFGPGATNLAASRFGGGGGSTEVDVSNAFVSLGLIGGVVYVGILILAFRGVVRRYLAGEPLALAVLALLVTCLGQWLTGGLYALMPLFWFLLGWASEPCES